MPPKCGYKGCIKQGFSVNKATNGKFYCNLKHLKAAGAKRDEVAKAKDVSSKFVPCSFSLYHYSFISLFLLSFSSHHHKQKLRDDKKNGKRSLALSNAAMAENARLREQGVSIDPDLTPGGVYDVAKRVADQLVADLPNGHRFYVLSSYSGERIKIEAWACTSHLAQSRTHNRDPVAEQVRVGVRNQQSREHEQGRKDSTLDTISRSKIHVARMWKGWRPSEGGGVALFLALVYSWSP